MEKEKIKGSRFSTSRDRKKSVDTKPTLKEGKTKIQKEVDEEEQRIIDTWKGKIKYEEKKFNENTDTEFWFAVVCPTREFKDEVLKKLGLWEIDDKFIDGVQFAEKLGLKINSRIPGPPKYRSRKGWKDLR